MKKFSNSQKILIKFKPKHSEAATGGVLLKEVFLRSCKIFKNKNNLIIF